MAATKLTISEALSVLKTLRERHQELVELRNANSHKTTRLYGANADREKITDPTYDVKKLDQLVTQVAREIRKVDTAIKAANAKLHVPGYEYDDSVLGEVA